MASKQRDDLGRLVAEVTVDDDILAISAVNDPARTGALVRAVLDSHIADDLAEQIFRKLAGHAGLSPNQLVLLLEFLGSDPEIQGRFAAFTAGKRITQL